MGSSCACVKDGSEYNEIDIDKEKIKDIISKIKTNPVLMKRLKFLQSLFKGYLLRKRLKSLKGTSKKLFFENQNFREIKLTKSMESELTILNEKYMKLQDKVNVISNYSIQYDNKAIYFGEWNKSINLRHGRGIQTWSDGSRYEGYWKNDKANIRGKLTHNDGDIYEGEWLDDKAHGYGTYYHIDGAKYEGQWKDDKQHGKGKESWNDGAYYIGGYENGKKSGQGKFQWSDGSEFEGNFVDNNINGRGVYVWGDSRKYDGEWKNNKMEGQGIFEWPDGKKYFGEFKNDKKEGYGRLEWPDGKKYRGYWKNGKQDGEGEFYSVKEEFWKKGFWVAGKRTNWLNTDNQ